MPRSDLTMYRQAGLTLKEILLLVLILAALVGGLYPVVQPRFDEYQISTAQAQLNEIAAGLERYKLDNHFYPTSEQGLKALVIQPTSTPIPRNWNPEGYLSRDRVPLDPWGASYLYTSREDGRYFELKTLGADGKPGGEGVASDLAIRR